MIITINPNLKHSQYDHSKKCAIIGCKRRSKAGYGLCVTHLENIQRYKKRYGVKVEFKTRRGYKMDHVVGRGFIL